MFFESRYHYISLFRPGSCPSGRISLRKVHVRSSLTIVIFPYVAPAVAQVLEVAFGIIPVASSFTIVIFPYVVFPAVAQVLEEAFGKIHVCSCLTVVIFPYEARQLHKC